MDIFFLKLILSFIVGSVWITCSTVFAEKFGSKVGGVLAGMPSTIVIALFFIGWTQGITAAAEATTIVPVVMGVGAIFVVVYALLSSLNFIFAIIGSLGLWFILTLNLVSRNFHNFSFSLSLSLLHF